MAKKYYWLKLQRDFFKRHDIKIIEAMPNGKDYILFYLKLLVESIDHEGELRFSDTIPYSEEMLSVITGTNIDMVRAAMNIFCELGMIQVLEDKTIYMAEIDRMIGSESSSAERMRKHRQKALKASHCDTDVTKCDKNVQKSDTEKEIDIDIDIEIEKDIELEKEKKKKKTPTVKHKHGGYGHVLLSDEQYHSLVSKYGEQATLKAIEYMDNYCEANGKRYKNYKQAMENWTFAKIRDIYGDSIFKSEETRQSEETIIDGEVYQ